MGIGLGLVGAIFYVLYNNYKKPFLFKKDEDLKDLKEENDLSDQGIAVQPKPFKSVTEENNRLNAIKADLEEVIKLQGEKIDSLTALYDLRFKTTELDEVNLFYKKKIQDIKDDQLKAKEIKYKFKENQSI